MSKTLKPNWSNTFNTNLGWWGHISKAHYQARLANYPFMLWNGRILDIRNDGEKDTGLLLKDLTNK